MIISKYLQDNSIVFPELNCNALVKTFGYSRGVLPHLSFEEGIFSVTTRLYDSIPLNVIGTLRQQLGLYNDTSCDKCDTLISPEKMNALQEYWKRIQDYEDAGCGCCFLRFPMIAEMVVKCLKELAMDHYELLAWSVMPNHLHLVLRLLGIALDEKTQIRKQLGRIMQRIKGTTAIKANRMLGRSGEPFWQKEYFDRYIRSEQHLRNAVKYILNNPRKTGASLEYTGTIFDDIL